MYNVRVQIFAEGNSHMTVYLREDIPEELHYKNNDRVPSVVAVADPGFSVYPVSF